jgi:hypothetical protein
MRDDLAHLTPEALAQLTNAGLVKRAVRELAAGYRPQIAVDDAQTIEARFDDGVACHWPRSTTIQNARCSCGAAGVCRHRVIVALACRERAAEAAAETPGSPEPVAPMREVASVSDDELARVIPAALLQQAERLRAEGIAIDIRRRAGGEPCDTARLPSATVRFWAGGAIEAARCDCIAATGCAHVALGVWAFRAAERPEGNDAITTVRLGPPGHRHAIDSAPFEQAVQVLLQQGVLQGSGALAQGFTAARAAANEAAWLALVVADLETWAEAFAQRSALYEAGDGVDLVAELGLRLAAGRQPGQAGAVLGIGQAGETALDRLRLMALGARTARDGEQRVTTLLLADIDTGTRLVMRHPWRVAEADEAGEATLRAAERVAPGVRLEALAQGQLLAQQAARRADGSVRLARARSAQNSVLPQAGDWAQLAPPLRFASVAALRAEARAHPHAALQPRHAARRHVVFSPQRVSGVRYDANTQTLVAALADAEGEALLLHRAHERHTPHALDAIAAALDGRSGALRHVAGTLSWQDGVPCIEPWALACDHLVVPDLATRCGALPDVLLGRADEAPSDACTRALDALGRHLAEALHHGMRRLPPRWRREGAPLAHTLAAAGLRELSQRVQVLHAALEVDAATTSDAARAFMTLAALRQLHRDATAAHWAAADAGPLSASAPAPHRG